MDISLLREAEKELICHAQAACHKAAAEIVSGEHDQHTESAVAPMFIQCLERAYLHYESSVQASCWLRKKNDFRSTIRISKTPSLPALHTQLASELLAAGENEFAGHDWHVEEAEAPVFTEYWPAGHEVHAADPETILYFPAAHTAQVPPFAPVYLHNISPFGISCL